MAKIEDLVRQIADEKLRDELANEVRELKKHKRFGLVFEEHLPEMLRLPKAAIRVGNLVAHRDSSGNEVWRVIQITGKKAKCRQPVNPTKYDQELLKDFASDELVLVVSFGEPIYPVLTPIDRVARGGLHKPWHALVNADNYHALQLLLYTYERKVDVIYIDPPYNTGARDWKYNNDYVDKNDTWRHSKWLSMMKKRLALAKRLLNRDGILIITVDDNEVHHLLTLTEELFPGYEPFVVTIEHNKRGRRGKNFGKSNEFALFFVPGNRELISEDFSSGSLGGETRNLRRTGSGSRRHERPRKFFPIWVKLPRGASSEKQNLLPYGRSIGIRLKKIGTTLCPGLVLKSLPENLKPDERTTEFRYITDFALKNRRNTRRFGVIHL
jgi:adenine-specific DNA-methyltransferase